MGGVTLSIGNLAQRMQLQKKLNRKHLSRRLMCLSFYFSSLNCKNNYIKERKKVP